MCTVHECLYVPSPISTRLDWLVALPSWSWKVNVPSSSLFRVSMNISMMPVFLSKFILYFYNTKTNIKCMESKSCSCECINKCVYFPLTSPWEIILSLNTYSTFPLADIFSAWSQKRTLPFSSNSTASSLFRGITAERQHVLLILSYTFPTWTLTRAHRHEYLLGNLCSWLIFRRSFRPVRTCDVMNDRQ